MCNNCVNEISNPLYINIQTGEVLDLDRVSQLKNNAMLKVKPELWFSWNFEKNTELGFDIWKMTKSSTKKAWWKCFKCDSEYDSLICNKTKGTKCPYCVGKKVNHTNSLASLYPEIASQWHPTLNGDLTPFDVTAKSNKKVWWQCDNGHDYSSTICNRNRAKDCPICSNRRLLVGFNDMWSTNPELAKLLANPKDGYKYMQNSDGRVDWKCPCCEDIIKDKRIADICNYGFYCATCSKSTSLPERIMSSLLRQLDKLYIHDKTQYWSSAKRYDFYIPSLNIIIETHGGQHYGHSSFANLGGRSLEEEQVNDTYKYELAIQNGIKPENYIVIDCRYSSFNFIKENILNSRLAEIFDLSNVNWDGLLIKTSEHFDTYIGKFHKNTRNTNVERRVYQYSKDKKLIKTWDNLKHIYDTLGFTTKNISGSCRREVHTSCGYIWRYEDDNEFK